MRRVGAWGRRLLSAHLVGGLACTGCGGKVGTLHQDGPQPGLGGTPSASSAQAGASGAGAVGGGGASASDGDDVPEASTDDACPCPVHSITPGGSLVHFASVACYCSSATCPSTRIGAEQELCHRVGVPGAGEVIRAVGCGLVRVGLRTPALSFDWLFEEGTDVLVGAQLRGDSPSGRCSVNDYLYGDLYECQTEQECHVCGQTLASLTRCVDTL